LKNYAIALYAQQNLGFAPPITDFVTPSKRYNQRNRPEVIQLKFKKLLSIQMLKYNFLQRARNVTKKKAPVLVPRKERQYLHITSATLEDFETSQRGLL